MMNMLETWEEPIREYFSSEDFEKLGINVARRRKVEKVYPERDKIFRCFNETPYKKTLGVILGQDPYPQPGVADGLCFSTNENNPTPASLMKIHKAIEKDCYDGFKLEQTNDLSYLSEQGILMLNTSLTVAEKLPGSHAEYWSNFTKAVMNAINDIDYPIFVLALGQNAGKFASLVTNHNVFTVEHPAAASYQGREWNNESCFRKINEFLWTHYGPLNLIKW
jgi:uracil-DNA glycosylase